MEIIGKRNRRPPAKLADAIPIEGEPSHYELVTSRKMKAQAAKGSLKSKSRKVSGSGPSAKKGSKTKGGIKKRSAPASKKGVSRKSGSAKKKPKVAINEEVEEDHQGGEDEGDTEDHEETEQKKKVPKKAAKKGAKKPVANQGAEEDEDTVIVYRSFMSKKLPTPPRTIFSIGEIARQLIEKLEAKKTLSKRRHRAEFCIACLEFKLRSGQCTTTHDNNANRMVGIYTEEFKDFDVNELSKTSVMVQLQFLSNKYV